MVAFTTLDMAITKSNIMLIANPWNHTNNENSLHTLFSYYAEGEFHLRTSISAAYPHPRSHTQTNHLNPELDGENKGYKTPTRLRR